MPRRIVIRVLPRSSKDCIVGIQSDGSLKIKLAAPPVEGEANQRLIKFLRRAWRLPKSKIRIASGERSRRKIIEIED